MEGFGVLGVPLGLSGAGPKEQKERPEIEKQKRFRGHREQSDIHMCFAVFSEVSSFSGGPNDGLEAVLERT